MKVPSDWDPYFIAGMTDTYFEQTYRDRPSSPGYVRYKLRHLSWQHADELAEQRERARIAWVAEHGLDPDGWPIPHPTALPRSTARSGRSRTRVRTTHERRSTDGVDHHDHPAP